MKVIKPLMEAFIVALAGFIFFLIVSVGLRIADYTIEDEIPYRPSLGQDGRVEEPIESITLENIIIHGRKCKGNCNDDCICQDDDAPPHRMGLY